MLEKAHSSIILCLGDKVLREVSKEESAMAVWLKLESLYILKSLVNCLYLKQRFKKKRPDEKDSSSAKGLFVRERTSKRDFKNKTRWRSRLNTSSRTCYTCNKEGHFKRECPVRKKGMALREMTMRAPMSRRIVRGARKFLWLQKSK